MAWTKSAGEAIARLAVRLAHRGALEPVLDSVWSLRGAAVVLDATTVATYVGPRVGGRLVVRYAEELVIGAVFVPDDGGG